jgi:putative ABC transport system permease protein
MLSLASARANRVRLLGSFVALTLGVTMITMTALLLFSARPQVPQRFSAVSMAITPHPAEAPADTFPAKRTWSFGTASALATRLSALPGVRKAILDKPFYAQAIIAGKPAGPVTGNDWETAALGGYRLLNGTAPADAHEVVIPSDLGLKTGDTVTILTAPGPSDYRVSGLTDGQSYYFQNQHHLGVPAIALLSAGEVSLTEVEQAVAGLGLVLTGESLSALESPADARTRWIGMQVLTAMGALSTFVAVFLVAATFSFSVLQRRRELGLLRAIGATPRQLHRMLTGEALLVGVVAGLTGVALGTLGAPVMGSVLVDGGFEPAGFTVRTEPLALAAAFLTGLIVTVAGVWLAARRAARAGPLEALRTADAERKPMTRSRWAGGALALSFGSLSAIATASADALSIPNLTLLSAMLLVTGISLLSPVMVPPLARILMAPFSQGPVGLLVRQSAFTAARRTASTAAPVLLTVSFAMLITGMVATGASAYAARRANATDATAVLVPDGTPGLTHAAVAAAISASGSAGVSFIPTTVFIGRTPLLLTGVSSPTSSSPVPAPEPGQPKPERLGPEPERLEPGQQPEPGPLELGQQEPGRLETGQLETGHAVPGQLVPGEVTVSQSVATRHGWTVGSVVEVTVANGRLVPLRIGAVAEDSSARFGAVVAAEWVPSNDPSALTQAVLLAAGEPGNYGPGAKVLTPEQYAAQADAEEDRLVWTFTLVLVLMAAGFSLIAVANTLLMSTAGRAQDLHVLRKAGATNKQLLRLVAAETTLVVLIGSILGLLVATGALLAIRAGLSEQTGHPVPLVIAWPTVTLTAGMCLLAGLLASVLPAHALLRRRQL